MTNTIDIIVSDEAGKFSSIPELSPELTVREVLEAAKSFLDLADSNTSYFLTLEKATKPLDNSHSLKQAGLQNNDRLILIKYEATEYQSESTKQESPQKPFSVDSTKGSQATSLPTNMTGESQVRPLNRSGTTKVGRIPKSNGKKHIAPKPQNNIPLFIGLGLIIVAILAGAYSLINAPSIELICRQMGNCQKFKEDANKAQESFNRAEKSFKSKNSLPELLAASKSIDEAKSILSAIPDNAKDLVTPIAEQRTKIADLDKKIAILLTLEENADKSLKEAITKIKQADALDRNPQGEKEDPNKVKERLAKPKAIYIESKALLKSIPEQSLVAADRQANLTLVSDKIKDLDNKLGAIKDLDPCVVNPESCKPVESVAPCVANPAACRAPTTEPETTYNPPATTPPRSNRPLFGPGSY